MKKFGKQFIALATACAVLFLMPTTVHAAWIDGDTPDSYNNRVTDSYDNVYTPTVMTNFHAPSIGALVPYSSRALFDQETKADVSYYDDARSVVYVVDNTGYGTLAESVLDTALSATSATAISTITLNLFEYEGSAYKEVTDTDQDLEYKVMIPESVRSINRDYCMIRINADGTYTYLTDLDTDSETLTFATDYYAANNLYCFCYAASGAFDAYEPVADVASTDQTASTESTSTCQTTTVTTTTTTTTTTVQ